MAQWQHLLRLNLLQGHLSDLYETKFPRYIRHSLCVCIESQDWDLAAVNESKASACFQVLLEYLGEQWNRSVQENNVLQAPDFPGMRDYLMKHFKDEPQKLAIILSECLKEEKKVLALVSEKQGCSSPAVDQKWRDLDGLVTELKRQMAEVKKETKSLEVLHENLDYIQKTWLVQQNTRLPQSHAVNEECVKHTNFIIQTKEVLLQQIVNILKQAEQIVTVLTDVQLPEWKRRQQMACIGCPVDTCLDHLQKWFTTVAEVLLQIRQQLQKLQEQNNKYNYSDGFTLPVGEIETFALSLLTKLLANSLVVEKQPIMTNLPQRPLILKTEVRFTATVRFLSNLPEFKYLLKVKPIFDKDVEEARTVKGFRHFDFSRDNSKVLDVDTPSGGLVAEFAHMSLKQNKARNKGSSESRITEELHIIKFVMVFQHAGLDCTIEVSSLPVIVISSTSQVSSAWASIMWCNMLSTSEAMNLSLFADPPPLTWQQVSKLLSWQFLSTGQRELDENQLFMLRDKFVDDPEGLVQWSKFSKNDSNWVWIDGILDLIRKHLVDLWREGYIMGFVSRERTRLLMQDKPTGTFLLRFSESNKEGAITFSWVEVCNCEAQVHAVEPYTKKELLAMPLPDIIYLYSLKGQGDKFRNPLIYLYPDIPKDTAFGPYYKASATMISKKEISGYVNRTAVPFSVVPTPPHSPYEAQEMHVDTDQDMNVEIDQFFSDILNLPGSLALWTTYEETEPV
ncbi:signal transducer and activator of transcription 1-alpha/beta-like isoform X2 [Anabas testudineus]|uniref:signal transducer and activator of transcription 1-alpha/beta-like isoform X2 n=1 Tax=Anabas testudineus TaxID=64144 RepID=UPI000E4589EE|nr:signal transducer and activator of transcription 1-alpha/beta-like isoform X2 [Anabas testudineus]